VVGAGGLLRDYAAGWLAGDIEMVLETVADDVVIVESHGPRYQGAPALRAWLEAWVSGGDLVHRWEITRLIESADGAAAAAEWDFACTAAGVRYDILGATIATARNGRLTSITEYARRRDTLPSNG
jgi:ketosteroid isomerase-like protein